MSLQDIAELADKRAAQMDEGVFLDYGMEFREIARLLLELDGSADH